MKIAAITITLNDDFKFKEWVSHYQLYKDDVYLHIIVDNGSSPEYVKKLEEFFPESHIIKRNSNGGCTESYNDGIKYALEKKLDIDYPYYFLNKFLNPVCDLIEPLFDDPKEESQTVDTNRKIIIAFSIIAILSSISFVMMDDGDG